MPLDLPSGSSPVMINDCVCFLLWLLSVLCACISLFGCWRFGFRNQSHDPVQVTVQVCFFVFSFRGAPRLSTKSLLYWNMEPLERVLQQPLGVLRGRKRHHHPETRKKSLTSQPLEVPIEPSQACLPAATILSASSAWRETLRSDPTSIKRIGCL